VARQHKQMELTAEADMTPMIDMTFQLIAFFMVLINFAEDNMDDRVKLPASQLAKVPDASMATKSVVLQVSRASKVLFNSEELPIGSKELRSALLKEAQVYKAKGLDPSVATVIIRGHALTPTGKIQELIKICQEKVIGFEKFSLRAEQGEIKQDSYYLNPPVKQQMGIR